MNRIARVVFRMFGIARPAPKTRIAMWSRRAEKVAALMAAAYLALQACPQPLFAHSLTKDGITFYSREPLDGRAGDRLAQVRALVDRSELAVPNRTERVFFCNSPWLFRFFAPLSSGALAVSTNGTDNIFIAEADVKADLAISSSGDGRPLSGVVAHEITHGLIRHRIGIWRSMRLPKWVAEGYCEYVARSGSFPEDKGHQMLIEGESSDSLPFRYFLYRQMVRYLFDERHLSFEEVLARSREEAIVEKEMRAWIRGRKIR
jgi:hypothetical protein